MSISIVSGMGGKSVSFDSSRISNIISSCAIKMFESDIELLEGLLVSTEGEETVSDALYINIKDTYLRIFTGRLKGICAKLPIICLYDRLIARMRTYFERRRKDTERNPHGVWGTTDRDSSMPVPPTMEEKRGQKVLS